MEELEEIVKWIDNYEIENDIFPHAVLIIMKMKLRVKDMKAKNNEVLDLVSQRELLNELINNQEEIISSPIRFNGVSIEKIKQVFEKNGVKYELPF